MSKNNILNCIQVDFWKKVDMNKDDILKDNDLYEGFSDIEMDKPCSKFLGSNINYFKPNPNFEFEIYESKFDCCHPTHNDQFEKYPEHSNDTINLNKWYGTNFVEIEYIEHDVILQEQKEHEKDKNYCNDYFQNSKV